MGAQTDFPNRGALPCFIAQMGCENIKFGRQTCQSPCSVFGMAARALERSRFFARGFALVYEC